MRDIDRRRRRGLIIRRHRKRVERELRKQTKALVGEFSGDVDMAWPTALAGDQL